MYKRQLLHGSFLGMEGGNALARTLFGEVNPSGKLTTTWCKHLEDMPDHVFGEYPGINDTVRFKEGLCKIILKSLDFPIKT